MRELDRPTENQCPFLGCFRDKATVYSYPTRLNHCYAQESVKRRFKIGPRVVHPSVPVDTDRQKTKCLVSGKWEACPYYQNKMKRDVQGRAGGR